MGQAYQERKTQVVRKSSETEISCSLNIDGKGEARIKTQIGFLDHMLALFAFHGFFDMELLVQKADLQIDIHHTNEDIGIVLGKTFKKALDEKQGIRRFGSGFAPMESTLGHTVIDIGGRGYFSHNLTPGQDQEGYSLSYMEHLLESFAHSLGATLVVQVSGQSNDLHTNLETVFKSLGLALDQATQIDPRRAATVPSTKGVID
ncbi:MAG TPA: imidazoleglycerol-phosphate dehydratase [Candidatus Omnitrophota bacterium]|nr:imidazoleglycerol-phosphate dehydratase [Candidatus Omnitrophota bacterium]HPB67808.1 imidazoleglycerol-phosphate dehydratase [Candidatus Omnitrophota bacterium]HQO58082.1 imidazoleglycerol-phosphate dehydratase [Candidatus Omnitrophota bacterium]